MKKVKFAVFMKNMLILNLVPVNTFLKDVTGSSLNYKKLNCQQVSKNTEHKKSVPEMQSLVAVKVRLQGKSVNL